MYIIREWKIDPQWTLFLDRDGVINPEKHGDYIRHVDEFQFYEGVKENFHVLNKQFGKVLVVTNQRGIGKGLMTIDDLHDIHSYMNEELRKYDAHIDSFYFAPELENDSPNRKPNTGMGLQAKEQYPHIDFKKSIMVGNNLSDMEFGKKLGMKTVYVETTKEMQAKSDLIDQKLIDFLSFIELLKQ